MTLHSQPFTLGTVTTDADGAVAITATVPSGFAIGPHVIRVSDGDSVLAERAITVTALETTPSATPPGQSGTSIGLARTGSDLAAPIWFALRLVAAGAAAAVKRRRRTRPVVE